VPVGEAPGVQEAAGVFKFLLLLGVSVATKRKSNGEHEIYERQAIICKAFANPTRLHLIEMLTHGERWAAELQKRLGISKANLSQHLAILKSAGLVSTRRDGKQLQCAIAMPEVKQATTAFRNMLKAQGKESRRWS
jgi:DNA-binding transcriptional ArsR family regulator